MASARGRARIGSALVVAGALALGVAVRPAALQVGFAADDFAQLAMLDGRYPVPRHPSDLFDFCDGSPAEVKTLVQTGFFPWWSHPEVRLSMWRPLSSLLLWLDAAAFGSWALGYHLHSLLWWFAMTIAVAALLGRLLPRPVAALALLLFVLDECHGVLLAWIANRNALCSTTFGVLALLAYQRARERASYRAWVGAAAAYCAALGCGEYALTFLGYGLAYELCCGRGTALARLRAFAALLLPAAAYLSLRGALGYGPRHSGIYVDPFSEPGQFLRAASGRFPIFFGDLLATVRADYWTFGMPYTGWLYEHGLIGRPWLLSLQPWRAAQIAIGAAALLGFGLLWWAVRRGAVSQRGTVDWLALGALLSVMPAIAPFPSSRLLVAPEIGVCALIALFASQALRALRGRRHAAAVAGAALAGGLLALHVVRPVEQTWTETRDIRDASRMVRRALSQMEVDPRALPRQRLVVMNAEDASAGFYLPLIRARFGEPVPRSCWVLSGAHAPFLLTREGPRTLRLDFLPELPAMAATYEVMFRAADEPLRAGQVFALDGLRVQVLRMQGDKLLSARFELDVPLEDPGLFFVHAQKNGLRRFVPPAVGQQAWVQAPIAPALMQLGAPRQ